MPTFSRLLVCSFVLAGCSVASDAPLPEPRPEAEDRLGDLPDEDDLIAQVCTPDHYVAIMQLGTKCPVIDGWEEARLFSDAQLYASAEEPSLPPEMARYCTYTWTEDEEPAWQQLESFPQFESTSRDCLAVTAQTDPLATALAPALRDNFRWLAGRLDATDLDSPSSEVDRSPTQVAVVDTFPHHEPSEPNSDHGPVMQTVVKDIACPQSTCAVDVPAYLGLPRTEEGVDLARGGYIGRQSDLARAIYVATEDYRQSADAGTSNNLVINLSVGWEPSLFGDAGSGNAAVGAVYVALERARCVGGLPVVAAGNSSGLRCSEQPLAPAIWEQFPRPNAARCGDLGLSSNSIVLDTPGGYSPLVYAVGGLASPTESMAGTRNDGKPRLFAPASHVVAGDPMTPSMTGTSLAAATVSGAAALLWSYQPSLTPNHVMQILYAFGANTNGVADFGLNGATPPIHRLDTCASLAAACLTPGANCGNIPALSCSGPIPHTPDDLFAIADDLSPTRDVPAFKSPVGMCNNACGLNAPLRVQSGLKQSCNGVERDPTLFLTRPQPPENGCEDCVLADDFASLSVADTRSNAQVTGVTVDVLDKITGRNYLYVVDPTMVSYGTVTELEFPLGAVVPRSAHVEFSFADPDLDTRDVMIVR